MGIEKLGIKFAQEIKSPALKQGYSRLKSIFLSGQNYTGYSQIVSTCKRPILGNIPKELINFVTQKYPKSQRGEIIKNIQDSFAQAALELRNALDKYKFKNGASADFELSMASKNIQAGLKDILPADNKVTITILEAGEYGCAFKVSITDAFGNKLMHDRALKIYKPLKDAAENKQSLHGINAEANSAYRFQHILGHKVDKQNFATQEFFDLEHGFSISQMADNELPAITSSIDFSKLGLKPLDLHEGNIVNGRIVDCGGIISHDILSDKTVLKYYKKIMNRNNLDERQALIERYSNLILNPKTPHREKIRQALDLAQKGNLEAGYRYTVPKISIKLNPVKELKFFPKEKFLDDLNFELPKFTIGTLMRRLKDNNPPILARFAEIKKKDKQELCEVENIFRKVVNKSQ